MPTAAMLLDNPWNRATHIEFSSRPTRRGRERPEPPLKSPLMTQLKQLTTYDL